MPPGVRVRFQNLKRSPGALAFQSTRTHDITGYRTDCIYRYLLASTVGTVR